MSSRVVLVQKWVPHYRVELFAQLTRSLASVGVELQIVHGRGPQGTTSYDSLYLESGRFAPARVLRVRGRQVVWQRLVGLTRGSDLVVVEQASGLLANYVLLLLQALGRRRVAFWGHGRNFERRAQRRLGERLKGLLARTPVWWFAYTDMSLPPILASGFPRARVTVLNNTIDTSALRAALTAVPSRSSTDPAIVFLGTLYPEKELRHLVQALDLVRDSLPTVRARIAGDGPLRSELEAAAIGRPWMTVEGPLLGLDKAQLLAHGDVLALPGRVGLVAVDAFCAGLPVVTRRDADHAPEFSYLVDGYNSVVVTGPSPRDFADALIRTLTDDELRRRLSRGARETADQLTIEEMVLRFQDGILGALAAKGRP